MVEAGVVVETGVMLVAVVVILQSSSIIFIGALSLIKLTCGSFDDNVTVKFSADSIISSSNISIAIQ